jgi:hypothetical protein
MGAVRLQSVFLGRGSYQPLPLRSLSISKKSRPQLEEGNVRFYWEPAVARTLVIGGTMPSRPPTPPAFAFPPPSAKFQLFLDDL